MLTEKQFIKVILVIFIISLVLNVFFYLKKPISKQVTGNSNDILLTIIPILDKCNNYTYNEAPPQLFLNAVRRQEIILTGIGPKYFNDYFALSVYGNSYHIKFPKEIKKQDLLTYLQTIKNKYFLPVNLNSDSSSCNLFHEFFIIDLTSNPN